jgi:hypothetical protein
MASVQPNAAAIPAREPRVSAVDSVSSPPVPGEATNIRTSAGSKWTLADHVTQSASRCGSGAADQVALQIAAV